MNKQNKEFQAWIGHLVDLYKILGFKFSNPHSYTKFRAIRGLQKNVNAQILIETGTYLGVTTNRCAPHFDKVYTIELDEELANKAKGFLSYRKNVEVIQGDGLKILPKVLEKDSTQNVLIFLDGHFSGGDTACGDLPEPALEELEVIAKYKSKVDAILVDDFRLFGEEPGFPKKSTLFQFCENNFPEYRLNIHLDQIYITRK